MSHHSTPRSAFTQKQEVISNMDENNDSLLDESNSFDLKNQIFELTSRYNNLEYEKNKMLMSYENVLKEQKQKYAILERLCSEKQEREEKLNQTITELRSNCAYLTEENDALKREIHSLFEKNRITPDFNTLELANEMNMLGDLLDKEQRVQKLDRQLQDAKEGEYVEMREKVTSLQKENKKLKEENARLETEKNQCIKNAAREAEQGHRALIKFKDAAIRKLEDEQATLQHQLEEARHAALQRNSQKSDEYAQHRRKEERIAQLQQKLAFAQKQRLRVHSENVNLQEDNKRMEGERKILQKSKKSLQQQVFRLTNQISEAKASAFNDKIETRKQVNSIKVEMQEEKNRLRSTIEEKAQENRRLREGILTLNDENQEMRDKQIAHTKQMEKIMAENTRLTQQNERYLREGNQWENFGAQSTKKDTLRENQEKIAHLQRELDSFRAEAKIENNRLNQLHTQLQRCNGELQSKQQLVEIMKIQKGEFDTKMKEMAKKLKQSEQSKNEKQKVILNLQSQIRTLKDDNRQLELANQQINERLETLRTINSDVENIKHQLQLEKQYYEEMRREEEDLRRKHKRSQSFKAQENSKEIRSQPLQVPQSDTSMKTIEQSREKEAEINKQLQHLKTQNYDLQVRITEAQNEINIKGIDINMKQEEIIRLKEQLNNPRELNFEPIIETSKKAQFNAVFLENKILLLQKEILGIKTLKDKQYEEYKKAYRKKIEDKYHAQMARSNIYIGELQKNVELLNNKLQRQDEECRQLQVKLDQLSKQNYQIKFDYSQTLEQFNSLLQKYKQLQSKSKELEFDRVQIKKLVDENHKLRAYVDKMSKNTEEKSLRLTNANEQIQKLNQTLMVKQSELKLLKLGSPNSSFISHQRSEQKSGLLNIPQKQQMEMHASSDTDSLRSWIKKSPNFSRV